MISDDGMRVVKALAGTNFKIVDYHKGMIILSSDSLDWIENDIKQITSFGFDIIYKKIEFVDDYATISII